MLLTWLLLAALAAVLIAHAVMRARARGTPRDGRPPGGPDTSGRPAQAAPVDPGTPAMAWADDEDEDATRVHMRTARAAAAVPPQRDGTAPAASAAHLLGLSGSQKDVRVPIGAAGITIGRHASCDVVLADHRVSVRHAWIGISDGRFVLRDLKSTNGTYINTQIDSSVVEIELRSGDTVFFGSHQGDQFRFRTD